MSWTKQSQLTSEERFQKYGNPYESFMKKHLQYYGYYTGRNTTFRPAEPQFEEWEKNHTYEISSESSSGESDEETDKDKDKDDKTQEELLKTTQLVYSYQSGKMVPRLREPRQLYGFNTSEMGPQQAARWPAEIQVLPERVKHIEYNPPHPEPLYRHNGMEKAPLSRSVLGEGRVVFDYEPVIGSFFIRSRVGGSRGGTGQVTLPLETEQDTTLQFESRFESGNLAKAVQVEQHTYDLWLRNDLYTNKHTQWFYFRVSNTRANVQYRFTIVNFMKPDSLYNNGMRPLMYSEKLANSKQIGWIRYGKDIKYYRNNVRYYMGKAERNYYSLTWTFQFPSDRDTCYFAHCYPYTYTDMQDYLNDIAQDPIKSKLCKQRVLCRTLAGNLVYNLTITSPYKQTSEARHRKAVVITSRVHPGESNASLMMKGYLDYLLSDRQDAKLLRDTFIFKIVPMLNPDGVIVGNYRCSLAGRDLNRNYKTLLKDSFPSVFHTKSMIKRLAEEREIVLYCDLHGHSRKQNMFIYGCENKGNPLKRLRERIFPVMLSKNAPDKFTYESCKFKVQKSKEGTGRIVMWNLGIMNSYTLEATFCGSSLGSMRGFHFSQQDFEKIGFHFLDTLLDYCDPDPSKERLRIDILHRLQQREGAETARNMSDINLDDFESDIESSDGGSDSSLSDGLPVHLQYMANKMPKKKKRLKSKKDRNKNKSSTSAATDAKKSTTPPTATNPTRGKAKSPQTADRDTAGKRPKSRSAANSGIPIFAEERLQERAAKKTDGYLEAITNAYLKSGVLEKDGQVSTALPHLRYTATGGAKSPNLSFNLNLGSHPEKMFVLPSALNHLHNTKEPGDDLDDTRFRLSQSPRSAKLERHHSYPRMGDTSSDGAGQTLERDHVTGELKLKGPQAPVSAATRRYDADAAHKRPLEAHLAGTAVHYAQHDKGKLKFAASQKMPTQESVPNVESTVPKKRSAALPKSTAQRMSEKDEGLVWNDKRSASVEISDTIKSINEIRHSLLNPAKRTNLSPTTGDFIDHFVRKTDQEVSAITADLSCDLQGDENSQKQASQNNSGSTLRVASSMPNLNQERFTDATSAGHSNAQNVSHTNQRDVSGKSTAKSLLSFPAFTPLELPVSMQHHMDAAPSWQVKKSRQSQQNLATLSTGHLAKKPGDHLSAEVRRSPHRHFTSVTSHDGRAPSKYGHGNAGEQSKSSTWEGQHGKSPQSRRSAGPTKVSLIIASDQDSSQPRSAHTKAPSIPNLVHKRR